MQRHVVHEELEHGCDQVEATKDNGVHLLAYVPLLQRLAVCVSGQQQVIQQAACFLLTGLGVGRGLAIAIGQIRGELSQTLCDNALREAVKDLQKLPLACCERREVIDEWIAIEQTLQPGVKYVKDPVKRSN